MAGYLPTCPPAVPVVLPFLLSMYCHVQNLAFLPSRTMRSETILPISCQKSATTFQLSLIIRGEVHTYASANFQDGALLDVAADGFWGSRFERAFFVVKVFKPYAPQIDDLNHLPVTAPHVPQRNKATSVSDPRS